MCTYKCTFGYTHTSVHTITVTTTHDQAVNCQVLTLGSECEYAQPVDHKRLCKTAEVSREYECKF